MLVSFKLKLMVLILMISEVLVGQDTANDQVAINSPYPGSAVIEGFELDTARISIGHGDNWAITWAKDNKQYSFFTDGTGFQKSETEVSSAPVVIIGDPPHITGHNVASETGIIPYPYGHDSKKVSGILSVDGVLYAWVRNLNPKGQPTGTGSTLKHSKDYGKTWEWASWGWPEIGYPSWLNAGKEYSAAKDDFVYFIAPDGSSAYADYPDLIMGRVHKDSIFNKEKYCFYRGQTSQHQALWGPYQQRSAIFSDPHGCFRPDIVYNEGLDRYFLLMSSPFGEWEWWANENPHRGAHLGIFDAPNPWGPWTTVAYVPDWGKPENRFAPHIPPKWISRDGREFYLLYSCIPNGPYQFNIQKCKLTIAK